MEAFAEKIAPACSPGARRPGVSPEERGRILVVDPRSAFAEGAAALLRREGYEAFTVYPATQAERRARRLSPELVLLGPGLHAGLERSTLARLRRATRTAGVPVFRIADASRPERIAGGFAAGLDDCILRPFFPDELFGRIDRALGRLRELRRLQSVAGLAAGRAAEAVLDETLRRNSNSNQNYGTKTNCLLLYLPGCEIFARSDRRDESVHYLALRRELPHRLAECLRAGSGDPAAGVVMAEPRPGQVLILPGPSARAFAGFQEVGGRLCRLLAATDRWLDGRGSTGGYLAGMDGGRLIRRPMPRFHMLSIRISGATEGFAGLWRALELELSRDHSGRAGGRFRRLRI